MNRRTEELICHTLDTFCPVKTMLGRKINKDLEARGLKDTTDCVTFMSHFTTCFYWNVSDLLRLLRLIDPPPIRSLYLWSGGTTFLITVLNL